MKQNRHKFIIIGILLISVLISYTMPRAQYKGTGFITELNLPKEIPGWKGRDITDHLNLDFDKNWNKFISDALIYQYQNAEGRELVFIILDAGNFHHPNVCFTASGYSIKEMGVTSFDIPGNPIHAHTLHTTKEFESNLSYYWIVIDKKIVQNWIEQKLKQLYFSLFNRQRIGLMVRIDVPLKDLDNLDNSAIADDFINSLIPHIPAEHAQIVFGGK